MDGGERDGVGRDGGKEWPRPRMGLRPITVDELRDMVRGMKREREEWYKEGGKWEELK